MTDIIKEKINIIVELRDDSSEEDKSRIIKNLIIKEGVRKGSVELIPRENAYLAMKNFLSSIEGNVEDIPFKDLVVFNLEADYYNESRIEEIKKDMLLDEAVLGFFAENDSIEMVRSNIKKMSYIALIIGAIFVFLSLAIIYNTMKLKLHADRLEIKTMQLVGATRVFIARPYIKEAIQLGFRAFLIVSTFVISLLASLYFNIEGFDRIINWAYAAIVLVSILGIGIILTVGVTRYVVRGYLNAERSVLV
jgi:cell division transport system permease protein